YANNRVSSIQVTFNGSTQTVLSDVQYEPFGAVKSWTWGNGADMWRERYADGNLAVLQTGAKALGYTYDHAQRMTAQSPLDDNDVNWLYGYDALDRLTSASQPVRSYSWTYDGNGNRLTQGGSVAQVSYAYDDPPSSNRLLEVHQTTPPSWPQD